MRKAQLEGKYNKISICSKCYVPFTELDGTELDSGVINIENIQNEIVKMSKKQKSRWINDTNLVLPEKAKVRA